MVNDHQILFPLPSQPAMIMVNSLGGLVSKSFLECQETAFQSHDKDQDIPPFVTEDMKDKVHGSPTFIRLCLSTFSDCVSDTL